MRSVRFGFAVALLPWLAGCGYIHFGRLPSTRSDVPSAAAAEAYTTLALEHKILKQELALARKEGDALRNALERAQATGGSGELAARLNETTRELATLRASYAKLQAERASGAGRPAESSASSQQAELEEKLATTLRDFTRLQEDNARLKTDVDRARAENSTLAEALRTTAAQHQQAQAALAQLNLELLAQKQARARAEQTAEAVRAQLSTVLAQNPAGTSALAAAREAPASSTGSLQLARSPPAGASVTAELRTSSDRPRRPAEAAPSAPAAKKGRTHIVKAGDTLEKIARQYYGAPDRWRTIYDANVGVLSDGQPLRAGMELQVPDN